MKTKHILFPILLGVGLSLIALTNTAARTASNIPYPISNLHYFATNWYVDAATGDDGDDCLTPATACLTIGGAVGKAASGDTIQIASGTYIEHLDININLIFI